MRVGHGAGEETRIEAADQQTEMLLDGTTENNIQQRQEKQEERGHGTFRIKKRTTA